MPKEILPLLREWMEKNTYEMPDGFLLKMIDAFLDPLIGEDSIYS